MVWTAFAFVGLGLDRVMAYLINAVEVPEHIRSVMEPMAFGVPFMLGIAIFVTSVFDIFKFIMVSVRQPYNPDQEGSDEKAV